MSYSCPDECTTTDLVPLPQGGCSTEWRKNTLRRLAFALCSFTEPSPYNETNTPPLFSAGTIVMSNVLRNTQWADPTTDTILIHDCAAPEEFVTGRVLTVEDIIKITTPAVSGSPGTPANPFADYLFWQDKLERKAQLRYGWVECDGNFRWARNTDGTFMEAALRVTLNDQKVTSGNANFSIEVKQVKLSFPGDPRTLTAPDFNLRDFGIDF